MKKLIGCFVSLLAVIAVVFGFTACDNASVSVDPDTYAFVTVDINPSVELITSGNQVIEVKAANYDACVLLDGEDFSSLTLKDAVTKIVSLAEELGYLNDSNNQVKISVISDDAQAVEILKSEAKAGAEKGSKKAVATTETTRLQDELTVKKLKEEKPDKFAELTEEKVRLIESVMEYDFSVTYESGAEMSVKQLTALIKSASESGGELLTAELRSEYSELYATKKYELERAIAAVYGSDYLDCWEQFTALEKVYNTIVTALDGLTEQDIAEVMQLLGITDKSLIEKGGTVKPDYVLSYIDKHINKKPSPSDQTAVDAVIEILGKYDADNYVLSDEEIALICAITGADAEVLTLADVAGNLSGRKAALNAMKAEAELTEDEITQIRALEENFSAIKESVLEEMQETIGEVKAQIAAEKQARLENTAN